MKDDKLELMPRATRVPSYEIQVCFDCLQMHANGDTGGHIPDFEPWGLLPNADVTMGSKTPCESNCAEGECECDSIPFSWSPCPACGTTLGGSRETFTVWGAPE